MNPTDNPLSSNSATSCSSASWERLRAQFHSSMMADTQLVSLAENIDGCHWPLRGPTETPAHYIAMGREEVIALLVARGQQPELFDMLAEILRHTLSFDDSFGDMLDIAAKVERDSDLVSRNLERLGIPKDFPVRLCAFAPGTHDLCRREQIRELAEFITFAKSASRQIVIGGEFRDLLNAIVHINDAVLARLLPYRPHTTGLYLLEGLGLVARALTPSQRESAARNAATLPAPAVEQARAYAEYFHVQLDRLRASRAQGTPLARIVAVLDNPEIEAAVAPMLARMLSEFAAPTAPASIAANVAPAPAAATSGGNASPVARFLKWLKT